MSFMKSLLECLSGILFIFNIIVGIFVGINLFYFWNSFFVNSYKILYVFLNVIKICYKCLFKMY